MDIKGAALGQSVDTPGPRSRLTVVQRLASRKTILDSVIVSDTLLTQLPAQVDFLAIDQAGEID